MSDAASQHHSRARRVGRGWVADVSMPKRSPSEMADSISGFLENLSPGENVFDAMRAQVIAGAFPPPSASQRREVFVLLVIHIMGNLHIFKFSQWDVS